MFRHLFSRLPNARRLGPLSRWNWWGRKVRRSRSHSYRPLVGLLEDRTLLSFLPPVSYGVDSTPRFVAVGDFNGDGNQDLAVGNGNDVSVLLGNGDGTFRPAVHYAAGIGPIFVAAGDFNGDGKLDLAVAISGGVRVLLGNGDGTFQPANVGYAVGFL